MDKKNRTNSLKKEMHSINPGEILRMELVEGRKLSIKEISISLKMTPENVIDLFNGISPITLDIAENLASTYGGTANHFMRLQDSFDLNKK